LEGRAVSFYVNGQPAGSATTDASGAATQSFTAAAVKAGDEITAVFEGDTHYLGSTAKAVVPKNKGL
jgi:hypothetical protein